MSKKNFFEAAKFFSNTAKKMLSDDNNRLHAEVLIISIGRMSGSLMYRTFGFDDTIKPGTAILSDKANIMGPKLMNMMLEVLQQLGHQITQENINTGYASASYSQLSFQESYERLAPFYLKYCELTSMSFEDAATAAAIALGMVVHESSSILPVNNGVALAVYGLVEGTKTAPYPLNDKTLH